MKYYSFVFIIIICTICQSQNIKIKVTDSNTDLPLANADLYFLYSTQNFTTDNHGIAVINLSETSENDELIVAKKNYQNVVLLVSSIKSNLNIQLNQIEEIELSEAVFTNLKAEDILRKVIENYDKNFNVDKYYFLVDLQQDLKIDNVYENSINLNLQLKLDKGKVKAKSSGIVKKKYERGVAPVEINFDKSEYFKHLYVLEAVKSTYENLNKNNFISKDLKIIEYAGKKMFEISLENKNNDKTYYLIDRETYSIVECELKINNVIATNKNTPLERVGKISYKYRPFNDKWVLKESKVIFNMNLKEFNNQDLNIDFEHKISTWNFSEKPFQHFNKNINLSENLHNLF